jgi:hypothetical protein
MKKWLLTFFFAAGAILLFWLGSERQHADRAREVLAHASQTSATSEPHKVRSQSFGQSEAPSASAVDPGPIASAPAFKPEPSVATNVPPLASELTGIAPETVIENMRTTIRQYGAILGGDPVGTNPEITSALQGQNPKGINFLKADGNRVNDQGELVDAWGTPYFFHQLSATEMEIRSAGPDRIMYTADDLVIK